MPDAERLTDEEREALERVAFDSGLGEHRFPEQTAERLADLVRSALAAVPRLAARAGDREEREGLRRLLSNRLERIEIDGMVRAGRHLALQQWLSALDILAPEVER